MKSRISKVLALVLAAILICVSFNACAEDYDQYIYFSGDDLIWKTGYNAKTAWAYKFLLDGDYEKAYSLVEEVIHHADEVQDDTDTIGYTYSLKEAYYLAAACTRFGDGTEIDYAKSGEYLMKAAELGHQDAQVWLGSAYRFGAYGFEQNPQKAAEWYARAVDQGEQDLIQLMDCYVCTNSYDHALISLAACYVYGEGVKKDEAKAAELLRIAADMGNLTACFQLGEMYLVGIGVEPNEKAAFTWLKKAAVKENRATYAPALLLTGYCYENGIGTPKDQKRGLKYYKEALTIAEANGDNETCADAKYYMALYYLNRKDEKNYKKYIQEAAALGHEEAQERLKEETLKQMKEVYEKAFGNGAPGSGYCGRAVTEQLMEIGILKKVDDKDKDWISGNGKDYFGLFIDGQTTYGGYTVEKYPKEKEGLAEFIKYVNKNNIAAENTYIALCFEKGGDDYASQDYGHVLLIHKIYNGNVYFMENWKNEKYEKGYIRCEEINNFLSPLGFGYGELTNKKNGNTYYIYDGAIWFRNPGESSK